MANTTGDKNLVSTGPDSAGPAMSSELVQTLAFVGVALGCLAITGLIALGTAPDAIKEYGKVGEDFYLAFDDPTKATALAVYGVDAKNLTKQEFVVQRQPDGMWAIPSHHFYPADAEAQLAKTASSMIGIKRGAMQTRWPKEHGKYGVVDPNQETLNVDEVEKVGKRITLQNEKGAVLVDLIIGEKVEDQENQYYVRHPEEDEVYIADLEIDLSTKFSDWINTDLLELDAFDVRDVTVNDYEFTGRALTRSEISEFHRDSSSDPWKLKGLNEETEELDKDAIRDTVDAMADLEIAGVRKKEKGLTPELEIERGMTEVDLFRLRNGLASRGYGLMSGEEEGQLKLISQEGELHAATEDGLVYRLYFGSAFTGSQEEIEIGGASADEDEDSSDESDDEDEKSKEEEDDGDSTDSDEGEGEGEEDEKKKDEKPGRYLFVRVDFDKSKLGDEPVKPTEPVAPADTDEPAPEKPAEGANEPTDDEASEDEEAAKNDDNAPDTDSENSEEPATEDEEEVDLDAADGEAADSESTDDAEKETEAEEADKPDPQKEYEEAKKQYEIDLKTYQRELEEYNDKIEEGQEKAEELNRRFADWYYVIDGDSFDKLSLARAGFIKAKEKEEEPEGSDSEGDKPSSDEATPKSSEPKTDESKPADEPKADTESKADAEPKADTEPKPDTEPKADESKPESESKTPTAKPEDGAKRKDTETGKGTDPKPDEPSSVKDDAPSKKEEVKEQEPENPADIDKPSDGDQPAGEESAKSEATPGNDR